MTTQRDAWEAAVDAVIAGSNINKAAFVDALQTVITNGLSNAEGVAFVDAVAVVYERIGLVNNPTYVNLRNEINSEGSITSMQAWDDLSVAINGLDAAVPFNQAARLQDLRDERDNINATLDRADVLIAAEPSGTIGRLIKDSLREGKRLLRQHKQTLRDEIQNLTGDPDS